ncbi:hypothetical protein FQN50_008387 [Emmonsiellopsis sp. PD_5]|nr:hypothetical protein FQN50_008387 [Emmonsiellopsis sp. PD_5]
MQFSKIIAPVLFFAGLAAARPAEQEAAAAQVKAAMTEYNAAVNDVKVSAEAAGCDWAGCILSLASEGGTCALAAAEAGLNIPMDILCLASVGNAGRACRGCP